jgi:hypothetical protein
MKHLGDKWWLTEGTRVIEDVSKVQDLAKEDFDDIVIMLGTNDVKQKQSDGMDLATKLLDQAERLAARHSHTKVKVVQIPPIGRRHAQPERQLFNMTLNRAAKDHIEIITSPRALEDRPTEEVLTDDLHLGDSAAKAYADEIKAACEDTRREGRAASSYQTIVKTTYLPEKKTGILIGKGGSNIREIEKTTGVKINVGRGNPSQVTVRGDREANVDEAIRRIEVYKERTEADRENQKRVECKFYQQGKCNRGSRCPYAHDSRGENREPRDRSRGGENQESRDRSRRRSRSREDDSARKIYITTENEIRTVNRR